MENLTLDLCIHCCSLILFCNLSFPLINRQAIIHFTVSEKWQADAASQEHSLRIFKSQEVFGNLIVSSAH